MLLQFINKWPPLTNNDFSWAVDNFIINCFLRYKMKRWEMRLQGIWTALSGSVLVLCGGLRRALGLTFARVGLVSTTVWAELEGKDLLESVWPCEVLTPHTRHALALFAFNSGIRCKLSAAAAVPGLPACRCAPLRSDASPQCLLYKLPWSRCQFTAIEQ